MMKGILLVLKTYQNNLHNILEFVAALIFFICLINCFVTLNFISAAFVLSFFLLLVSNHYHFLLKESYEKKINYLLQKNEEEKKHNQELLEKLERTLILISRRDRDYLNLRHQTKTMEEQQIQFKKIVKDLEEIAKINAKESTFSKQPLGTSPANITQRQEDDSKFYFERGKFQEFLGDLPGAIEDFTQAINFNLKYADAYENRGLLLAKFKKIQEAIEDLSRAAKYYLETDNWENLKKYQQISRQIFSLQKIEK